MKALTDLIAAIQKHKKLVAGGAPYALREAMWDAISMRACEAEAHLASHAKLLKRLEAAEETIDAMKVSDTQGFDAACKYRQQFPKEPQ